MKGDVTLPALGLRDDEDVVEFLRRDTDFFARHPDLLAELRVPHACGDAHSLIEYQVEVLRTQGRQLRERLHALVGNARDNEELGQRMHALTLALIECRSVDEIFTSLYHALADDFGADVVTIRLFAPPAADADRGLGEFVGTDGEARALFATVLESDKPLCGRIRGKQLDFLFGHREVVAASGALLPLGTHQRFGVLAIGSRNPQRFHPGMGTLFLRNLADVVTRVLMPHVRVD